ncbi:MAG: amidohydrolase family protein [Calditrichaeota bacterium]|nr:amidohydrolase family protein [Calditrichota bacterium]
MNFLARQLITANSQFRFELLQNQLIETDENGLITAISQFENQEIDRELSGLVMPGLTNAHSHGYQIEMRGTADNPRNFRDWVNSYLYPTVEHFSESDMRKSLKLLFRLMLRNGITTLGEFHYFHHLQADDFRFDQIFLEEAKEAGIRIAFLQSAYDLGQREAQQKFHANADSFIRSLEQIENWMKAESLNSQWSLSTAPHSLHGCSPDLMRVAVDWAKSCNRRWHIHLAEQKSDLDFSQEKYGTSPLLALQKILHNQLDDLCCLVHACWLSNEEVDLFNQLHINLVYNPFTNMYLGDGITETNKMNFPVSKLSLGTDSNNAFNMFTEVKLLESLQRVKQLEMGQINSHYLLASITAFSEHILNLPVGRLEKGYFADFIEIDFESLTGKHAEECAVDEIINHLIFSGMDPSFIKTRFIGGREIK